MSSVHQERQRFQDLLLYSFLFFFFFKQDNLALSQSHLEKQSFGKWFCQVKKFFFVMVINVISGIAVGIKQRFLMY